MREHVQSFLSTVLARRQSVYPGSLTRSFLFGLTSYLIVFFNMRLLWASLSKMNQVGKQEIEKANFKTGSILLFWQESNSFILIISQDLGGHLHWSGGPEFALYVIDKSGLLSARSLARWAPCNGVRRLTLCRPTMPFRNRNIYFRGSFRFSIVTVCTISSLWKPEI